MTQTKPLWRSKSFWAGLLGFLATLAGLVGVKIDPARTAELVEIAPLLVANLASVAGVVFRIMADSRIGGAKGRER
ncbi:MAG: hypothetical protein ABWZ80_06665 [Beijerinckiaceae bacterium]